MCALGTKKTCDICQTENLFIQMYVLYYIFFTISIRLYDAVQRTCSFRTDPENERVVSLSLSISISFSRNQR